MSPPPACPLGDRPPIRTILFDLDDTLYRVDAFPDLVRQRIEGASGGDKEKQKKRRAAGVEAVFFFGIIDRGC